MAESKAPDQVFIPFPSESSVEERLRGCEEIMRNIVKARRTPDSKYGKNTETMIMKYRENTSLYTGFYVPQLAIKYLENKFYNPVVGSWLEKAAATKANPTTASAPRYIITSDEIKKLLGYGEVTLASVNITLVVEK